MLEASEQFAEAGKSCVHGYRVLVKDRTLKRSTSVLKHARFLNNLEVVPVWPPEPEPKKSADDNNDDDDDQQDD